MSDNKPAQNNDASYMSSIVASHIIRALRPTRTRLRWSNDLHKIFMIAVAYQGGPHEAKPTAVKLTMEAMGVRCLTTQNIKSHLQKYREKCDLGAKDDVSCTTSSSKASFNQASDMVMDTDALMTEIEVVNTILMDDIEMVNNNFSMDQVQMMEKELMDETQLIEDNSRCPNATLDEYIDDLASYAFGHPQSSNFSM